MPQKRVLTVSVDCVDGETSYACTGRRKVCLAFLNQFDHEGSSLSLEENGDHFYNPEVVYRRLEGAGKNVRKKKRVTEKLRS